MIEQSAFKVIEERERARTPGAAEEYLAFVARLPRSRLAAPRCSTRRSTT